jgi:hypothetical protein
MYWKSNDELCMWMPPAWLHMLAKYQSSAMDTVVSNITYDTDK